MSVDLVLEGIRKGTPAGLRSARGRLLAWRDAGVGDEDKAAFDLLVEMVDEFVSRGSVVGTSCRLCGPGGSPGSLYDSAMDPLCIACVRRLRDVCADRGGVIVSGSSLWFEMHGQARDSFGEWGYHATLPEYMPTVGRIGLVPRQQPASHSSEHRGIPHAAVFFCDTAEDAACWNSTILRFPWPEMWGRDPYGEGQNLWTDRWIPPESLEMEVNREWVHIHTSK